jgi:hypothetical protein
MEPDCCNYFVFCLILAILKQVRKCLYSARILVCSLCYCLCIFNISMLTFVQLSQKCWEFRKQCVRHKMFHFSSITFFSERFSLWWIFSELCSRYTQKLMWGACYCWPILTEIVMWQILVKLCQISWKSVQRFSSCYIRTGRQMAKRIVAFLQLFVANAQKVLHIGPPFRENGQRSIWASRREGAYIGPIKTKIAQ